MYLSTWIKVKKKKIWWQNITLHLEIASELMIKSFLTKYIGRIALLKKKKQSLIIECNLYLNNRCSIYSYLK